MLSQVSKIAPWRSELHGSHSVRPSSKPVVWARSRKRGHSPRATETCLKANRKRGRCPSGWLFRVWDSRLHRDGGMGEGTLGLGCRSRAHLGVPRTGPSCPCCVAAAPRALHRVSRTGRSICKSRRDSHSTQEHQGIQGYLAVAPRAHLRVPRTRHSCEVCRRASSLANDK